MRGHKVPKKRLSPDPIYNDYVVEKLTNYVMQDGKKDKARKIVYAALEQFAKQVEAEDVLEALAQVIENVAPEVETKSKRIGGANLQIPTHVNEERQTILALRWIVGYSRAARKDKPYQHYLTQELVAAYNGEGASVKKKEETERMAESNKAFAQYA